MHLFYGVPCIEIRHFGSTGGKPCTVLSLGTNVENERFPCRRFCLLRYDQLFASTGNKEVYIPRL